MTETLSEMHVEAARIQQEIKDYLGLRDEDEVLGILYFGYSDAEMTAVRNIPLEEKIQWNG